MRFQITMNMPSRSGNSVHQIIADHPAESLSEFAEDLGNDEFIIVQEVYKDNEAGKASNYYNVGFIAINRRFVGKVKVLLT
jgi:hypothetical protein